MPHITLPEGVPGIIGPMTLYPDTEKPLNALAEALLCTAISLSPAERELIAAYTSHLNGCNFCFNSHAAVARFHFGINKKVVDEVVANLDTASVSDKMKALLAIAAKVQQGGRKVLSEDVARARAAGADDRAIHDTVLIAAAFCMFNRYVDGLDTWAPDGAEAYVGVGELLGTVGYAASIPR